MVVGVLYAITALVTGIIDAFIQIDALNNLMFHSAVFHAVLFLFFFWVAPYFARVFRLKVRGGNDGNA